jgi:type I restriction enzyme S subunit
VTWTAKPFSDLDIALEAAAPLAPDVLIDLEEAFEASDLPWKVDVIDLNAVSPEFRLIVERQRVPADWEETTLGEVVALQRGHDLPSDTRKSGTIPVMGSFGITGYHDVARAKAPGVTVGRSGASVGVVSYVDADYWPLNTCLFATDFKGNNPRFVYHLLKTLPLAAHNSGSAQPSLNRNYIAPIPVRIPRRSEQDRIVSVIAALDDKIELNRRMNETLEAMARSVFRDWFVDFGPTRRKAAGETDPAAILGGLLPDPTQVAPLAALFPDRFGANGLPEGWEERPLVGFLDIIGGGTPKTQVAEYWGGDIPWFSVVDTPPKGGVFVWSTEKTITERGVAESSVRMIDTGTTIISARGTVGNIAMAARPMTFNQSCYALRAVEPVGNIFVYLATERMVERLKAMAHGSVFSTITRSTFESLNFAWADDDVFSAFETLIEPMFELIKANGQENQTLAATRDLLLPKLMSGVLRLTRAEGDA